MVKRSKRRIRKGMGRRLIALLALVCITVGVGRKVYMNHKKNSKSTIAYSSTSKKLESDDLSETSSSFTPKIKDNDEDKEDKKNKKTIDINTDMKSEKNSTSRREVSDPKDPTIVKNSNPNKNSGSYSKSTENSKGKNNKVFFKNDVFMGDSIIEALGEYEFIGEKNVCAKKGININKAKDEVYKINIENPRNIYILYGANDMDNTVPSKWFIDNYRTLIHKVKDKFPNSKIYIQSIMPVLPMAEKKKPTMTNSYINQCNAGLMRMAREENVGFLNIKSVLNEGNRKLYENDGIHFTANFYPIMLNYIKNNVQ